MGQILPAYPTLPCYTINVTLSDQQYSFRFVWRDRTRSWYFDLYDANAVCLAAGRRLSPRWAPLLAGLRNPTDGYLYCSGSEKYAQEDFGKKLYLAFYENTDTESEGSNVSISNNLSSLLSSIRNRGLARKGLGDLGKALGVRVRIT